MKKRNAPPVIYNTGNAEWYTPPEIVDAARKVLGTIDLDPASSETANVTVKAAEFFDAAVDGLTRDWRGHVWLNPPYTRGMIEKFSSKLITEFGRGNVTEAICLTNASTDTKWFARLAEICAGCVIVKGRIRFFQPNGTRAQSPTIGQAIFYFGNSAEKFFAEFGGFGLKIKFLP